MAEGPLTKGGAPCSTLVLIRQSLCTQPALSQPLPSGNLLSAWQTRLTAPAVSSPNIGSHLVVPPPSLLPSKKRNFSKARRRHSAHSSPCKAWLGGRHLGGPHGIPRGQILTPQNKRETVKNCAVQYDSPSHGVAI